IRDADTTDGIIKIDNALFGTYLIQEIVEPSGYAKIVSNITITVHPTVLAPVIIVQNKLPETGIVEPVTINAPSLTSVEFTVFQVTGASVGGTPIARVDDLPSAVLAPNVQQIVNTGIAPSPITFTTPAPPVYTTQNLLDTYAIPKYPTPEDNLAQNNVLAMPPIVIPQLGSENKFLMTPVIEKTTSGMTVLLDQTVPVASGAAKIKQVEMNFSDTGEASNVAFSFGIS